MHWAAKYIGMPYERMAEGPHAYDCWGLARAVWREQMGLEMPHINIGENNNVDAMRRIANGLGWARVEGPPQEFDALIMQSHIGRHIAVAIKANGKIVFIHSDSSAGVEVVPQLSQFNELGYTKLEVWRYASRN